jgi:hypothetical protein
VARSLHLPARRDDVRDPALTALLIVQCLLIFVMAPYASAGYPGSREAFEATVIAFGALVVFVSRGQLVTAIAAVAVALTLTASWLNAFLPSMPIQQLSHVGSLGGSIVVAYVVGRAVLAPGEITGHRIRGAVVLYLNLGMIFATGLRLIWDSSANALSGIPADTDAGGVTGTILYFSFVTLTTVGYGDIVPVHPFARSLCNLEGIIGIIYPATLLARLVSLQLETRSRHG